MQQPTERIATAELRIQTIEHSIEKIGEAVMELKDVSIRQQYVAEELSNVNKRIDIMTHKMEQRLENNEDKTDKNTSSIAKFNTAVVTAIFLFGSIQGMVSYFWVKNDSALETVVNKIVDIDKRVSLVEKRNSK